MVRVGITGGIGSGKSVVSRIFSSLDVPVYDADSRAKELMTGHASLQKAIVGSFGPNSYTTEGQLNRTWLAQKVFSDKEALQKLNALVHPVLEQDYQKWSGELELKGVSICLKEAAILLESGTYKGLDHIVLVKAPVELRLRRVMERDGISRADVERRMKNQWSDAKKETMAHTVIINDEVQALIPQVLDLHQKLLRLEPGLTP